MSLPGGRRAVWGVLAAVVAVVAVVAGVFLTGGEKGATVRDAAADDTSLAQPADESSPQDVAAEPVPPDSTPVEKPEVTPQATALRERKIPEAAPEGAPQDAGAPKDWGGCDRNYGEATQCVPWTFPDGITAYDDKCLWLELNGFTTAIKVVGTDRQKLDNDGDKTACNG
ncbi:hypothetical protein [Actinocorallia populi]|uniref:hypothetical protein n=1 Tax=Actinocorallia populi TaxID=2079200 RepID=UPI00130077F1|nr:hypothetical protein [Actinocorallia populi]